MEALGEKDEARFELGSLRLHDNYKAILFADMWPFDWNIYQQTIYPVWWQVNANFSAHL